MPSDRERIEEALGGVSHRHLPGPQGELVGMKSYCLRGHPLSGDNVRIYKGWRICKACARARQKVYADHKLKKKPVSTSIDTGLSSVSSRSLGRSG